MDGSLRSRHEDAAETGGWNEEDDRGGDRQLNRALHTIVLTRKRIDPRTKAYISRRLSEGKTERDATRCLKRYLARSLYRLLEATPTPT